MGILATNTPDVLTETTADAIFGLLLSTARRIPELDQYVKERYRTPKNQICEITSFEDYPGKAIAGQLDVDI